MSVPKQPALLLLALAIVVLSGAVAAAPEQTEVQRIPSSGTMGTERFFGVRVAASDELLVASSDSHWELWDSGPAPYVFSGQTANVLTDGEIEGPVRVLVEPAAVEIVDASTGSSASPDNPASAGTVGSPYAAIFLPGTGQFEVYADGGSTWTVDDRITVPAGMTDVALDGDRLLVGYGDVPEVRDFRRTGGDPLWEETSGSPLASPEGGATGGFGTSVSVSGDWLAVGAPFEDLPPRGSRGFGVSDVGRVYLYEKDGTGQWVFQRKLEGVGADERLGTSVSLEGDRLLVGVPGASVDGEGGAGRVDVYELDGTTWQHVAELRAETPQAGGELGTSVDLTETGAVAGAPGDDPTGDPAEGRGAVYVFPLADPIFADGFETGDTSSWSS